METEMSGRLDRSAEVIGNTIWIVGLLALGLNIYSVGSSLENVAVAFFFCFSVKHLLLYTKAVERYGFACIWSGLLLIVIAAVDIAVGHMTAAYTGIAVAVLGGIGVAVFRYIKNG